MTEPSPQNRSLHDGVRMTGDGADATRDWLAVEAPLQININGKPFTVTMRTPGDDSFLVRGLLFTEGVVRGEGLQFACRLHPDPRNEGVTLSDVTLPAVFVCDDMLEKRSLLSNSSCGVCGKREASDIEANGPDVRGDVILEMELLPAMATRMQQGQALFRHTGGCHAAAAFSSEGGLIALFEDIGRHNAVDKVIGWLLEEDLLSAADVLLVSGRVSFEIVAKACRARIPFLAGVSAPSSLAVHLADRHGMTLLGFCRGERATVYAHPERIRHRDARRV